MVGSQQANEITDTKPFLIYKWQFPTTHPDKFFLTMSQILPPGLV
jgi:hypothetical protein